ncbi:MAG: hypothetical protein IJB84_07795 [Lachnospiraceae bacterium]|nr:hypothetical protein [Lachnospiraceae bacterium]
MDWGTLNSIKGDIRWIIAELDSIERGLRKDFKNIGTDTAADSVGRVADQYRWVQRTLNNMNMSKLSPEFEAKRQSESNKGGGGGGGGSF